MFENLKSWILIIISIILGFVIYEVFWGHDLALKINKHYEYLDCKIKYKKALFYTKYHWINDNLCEEYSAKYKLLRCLCDKYLIEKDTARGNYILKFFKEDDFSRDSYLSNIIYPVLDTAILIENCEKIFEKDGKILDFIEKYRQKDSIYFKQILIKYLDISSNARQNYKQVILNLPFEIPNLDTIIKYNKIIFSYPSCDEKYSEVY